MNILPISKKSRVIYALRRLCLLTLLALSLAGCFSPVIVANQPHECQLVTKQFKLTLSDEGSEALMDVLASSLHSCQSPECLLIIPLGVAATSVTSFIVSGSIVVVGNTIHWIEKQGTCENSLTQTVVRNVTYSLAAIGGKTIQSTTDFIAWIKQLFSD